MHQFQVVEITSDIAYRAMTLVRQHLLRGYDAVQLAAASELQTHRAGMALPPLTFLSADVVLNTVAVAVGLVADDPNAHE